MSAAAASIRRDIRRQSWRLKSVAIRQAARQLFDLTRFWSGRLVRWCSSLILAAAFFLLFLLVAGVLRLGVGFTLTIAITAFVSGPCWSHSLPSPDSCCLNFGQIVAQKAASVVGERRAH